MDTRLFVVQTLELTTVLHGCKTSESEIQEERNMVNKIQSAGSPALENGVTVLFLQATRTKVKDVTYSSNFHAGNFISAHVSNRELFISLF